MLDLVLYSIAGVCLLGTALVLGILYRTRDQRRFGIGEDSRRQGLELILWFAFLAVLVNVILDRLVAWHRDNYVLVLLPILLLMVALMLATLYRKGKEEY